MQGRDDTKNEFSKSRTQTHTSSYLGFGFNSICWSVNGETVAFGKTGFF
jgi:hypothetical protein